MKRFRYNVAPVLVVGVTFFIFGCQPKPVIETIPPSVKERPPAQEALALAERAFQDGDYHQALTTFQQILAENPNHPQADLISYQITYCLFQTGNHHQALNQSLAWVNRFPDHRLSGQAFFLVGRSYQALNEPDRALEWFIKGSKQYDPAHITRHEIDATIMNLIDGADIPLLEVMARQAAGSEFAPQIYYRLATRWLEENRPDEAREAAMNLVRSSEEQYWVSLGRQLLDRIEREQRPQKGVIGCLLPLTGPYAIYGQETLNGIQLGMDMFNPSSSGSSLELHIRDTASDVEQTMIAINELGAQKDLMAIIGPLAGQTATVAVQRARELEIPIIILAQREGLTNQGRNVYRNFLTPGKEVGALVDLAIDKMGIKRFGLLYPDNPYGRYYMNLFWDRLSEKGGVVNAVEAYPPQETDFGVQIKKMVGLYYTRPPSIVHLMEKLKREKMGLSAESPEEPEGQTEENDKTEKEEEEEEEERKEELEPFVDFEAVFIPDNHKQVALIAPQFPFHRVFKLQFLGTSLWESPELIVDAGDYVQGAVFPSGFFKDRASEHVQQFVEDYRHAFDSVPGLLAATGYDTIRLLKHIFENYKTLNRLEVQSALNIIKDFKGVTGTISFDAQGELEKAPLLLTVSGSRIIEIQKDE